MYNEGNFKMKYKMVLQQRKSIWQTGTKRKFKYAQKVIEMVKM
jgi:hypothetical protein